VFNQNRDFEGAALAFGNAAKKLEQAGAGCIVLCANTAHMHAGKVSAAIGVPLIHIADATLKEVRAQHIRKIGLLGTVFTMEEDFIKSKYTDVGIEVVIPEEADRTFLHHTIHGELARGTYSTETKDRYVRISEALAAHGSAYS
jgi:aspartate racemase